jgi:hypothetical protein
MPDGEFSVYQFFQNGQYEEVYRFTDAETAVKSAHQLTCSLGAKLATTRRVIITDGGDFTNFEWRFGQGVVFPPPGRRALPSRGSPIDPGAPNACGTA